MIQSSTEKQFITKQLHDCLKSVTGHTNHSCIGNFPLFNMATFTGTLTEERRKENVLCLYAAEFCTSHAISKENHTQRVQHAEQNK
jgi:hypothetical protein